MPRNDTATSEPALLIAAQSGRALAAAARRAGYVPLVADFFADVDTRELALRVAHLPDGFRADTLLARLHGLDPQNSAVGLVCGSGFEHEPVLLACLAAEFRLLGNPANVVAAVCDPWRLAAACEACSVAHPPIARASAGPGWLEKQVGGAGGSHVRAAPDGAAPVGRYRQRQLEGKAVSALFLADGRRACVLGFSDQWTDPAQADGPYRFGGGVRPAAPTGVEAGMQQAIERLTDAFRLLGLNSADFLVGADGPVLLEINPRPGASLDLFPHPQLLRWHVEACEGRLPGAVPPLPGAHAACVVYARRALRIPSDWAWPDWAADRQPHGSEVAAGDPVCTVLAAETPAAAAGRRMVAQRAGLILQGLEAAWTV